MSDRFDPRIDILPPAQQEICPQFAPATEDLLATKLKAILDRAEAKDYRDISAMLNAGVSLQKALGAFARMYRKDPGLSLRAIGFFKDGDLPSLLKADQDLLRAARDRVSDVPDVHLSNGLVPGKQV